MARLIALELVNIWVTVGFRIKVRIIVNLMPFVMTALAVSGSDPSSVKLLRETVGITGNA